SSIIISEQTSREWRPSSMCNHYGNYMELLVKRITQLSSKIVSNMIQTRDEVLITHDLPIAGNSNPLERETQCSRRLELQKEREDT
ncbi:hypothetical protein HID58_056474, partial [Brassica napus]